MAPVIVNGSSNRVNHHKVDKKSRKHSSGG